MTETIANRVFLVGGAVRDMAMGVTPKDSDFAVVGSSAEEMLSLGFSQVGADFPVFLHPVTNDEYALARTERKTGEGYLGFSTEFGPDVTLEGDLARRDLTVNSMALDSDGNFVDPFGGRDDVARKVLRHTSAAFSEDPVRVLRVARFRARFGADWTVAPETASLMASMSKSGALSHLNSERVWKELSRALMEPNPRLFFDTLLETDCLHVVFPEVYKLLTALESRKWHPEGNSYEHTMLVLTRAAYHGFSLDVRFAALVHDLGKTLTPFDQMPKHYGHDVNGVALARDFANRLTVPAATRDLAMKATRYHMLGHQTDSLRSKTFVKLYEGLDAWRNPAALPVLYALMVSDRQGRLGHEDADFSNLSVFLGNWEKVKNVKFVDVFPAGEKRPEVIKQKMFVARTATLN